jgi:hypothetical protein
MWNVTEDAEQNTVRTKLHDRETGHFPACKASPPLRIIETQLSAHRFSQKRHLRDQMIFAKFYTKSIRNMQNLLDMVSGQGLRGTGCSGCAIAGNASAPLSELLLSLFSTIPTGFSARRTWSIADNRERASWVCVSLGFHVLQLTSLSPLPQTLLLPGNSSRRF